MIRLVFCYRATSARAVPRERKMLHHRGEGQSRATVVKANLRAELQLQANLLAPPPAESRRRNEPKCSGRVSLSMPREDSAGAESGCENEPTCPNCHRHFAASPDSTPACAPQPSRVGQTNPIEMRVPLLILRDNSVGAGSDCETNPRGRIATALCRQPDSTPACAPQPSRVGRTNPCSAVGWVERFARPNTLSPGLAR
jgi:hypothetical protein